MRRPIAQLCFALALALPAQAGAQTAGGGAPSAPAPRIDGVRCSSGCEGGVAHAGSRLAITGSGLQDVVKVAFSGSAAARPRSVAGDRVRVRVPAGARTGPLAVIDALGRESAPSEPLVIERVASPERSGAPIATVVTARKAFVDGLRAPTLTYRLQTAAPAEVTVTVVRQGSGAVVRTFEEGRIAPGEDRRVAWRGARQGRYAFVVSAVGDGVSATTARARDADAFVLLGHKFPVRGRHDYGDGFGAGRDHEGADLFAACGTPLVAARGGRVKLSRYHDRAGHYVVIDGAQTGVDYMYAHLRDAPLVEQGSRVRTGDLLGHVGDSGNARGCHLHFELWSAPGWYTGGSPIDPMPALRAWDRSS